MIDYLNDSVTLQTRAGVDRYGQATMAGGVAVKARVEQAMRMIRNAEGEEMVSDAHVFLPPGTDVDPGDRVTYAGRTYQVLTVARQRGLSSEHHVLIFLGVKR